MQVPFKQTILSEIEFAKILAKGYKIVYGTDPSLELLGGAWAQAILESGRNPVRLPNNNVGNLKATPDWKKTGNYFTKDTVEFNSAGKLYQMPEAEWRAYDTPEEGAAGYWRVIGSKRYSSALKWMAAGDAKSAAIVFGIAGYYTANINEYSNSVDSIYKEFLTKIAPELGLKSNPIAILGAEPASKNWKSEYSDSEKEMALNIESKSSTDDMAKQVNELIMELVANIKLPESNVLVHIKTGSVVEKLEFARVTASMMRKFLNVNSDICRNKNTVEIQCSGIGTENKLAGAIEELCIIISNRLNKVSKIDIKTIVMPGFLSKHGSVNYDDLVNNRRQFHLDRIING